MRFDYLIAGGGLAGAAVALQLARRGSVLLLDVERADSASQAAVAGLLNPIMARRPRPVHEADRAMEAAIRLLDHSGCEASVGIVRPAWSPRQADMYRTAAATRPDFAAWVEPTEARERYPWLEGPEGVLNIVAGRSVSIPALISGMRDRLSGVEQATQMDGTLLSWREDSDRAVVRCEINREIQEISASRLILALGAGYQQFDALRALTLHPIKGQLVRVHVKNSPEGVKPISGSGYVVPEADGHFVIGSSYEHSFDTVSPRRVVSRQLLVQPLRMLPWLAGAEIIDEFSGIRVTVPSTRLPMVGPLPAHRFTWVFSGLSSKGLLMAPFLAEQLPAWIDRPESIPDAYRVRET